jgi:hypothetical protein
MSRIATSPHELESLLEARSRLRTDGRSGLRGREEPRMSAEQAHDADMLDVVQKFERVYAQLGAEQRERTHAPELAEGASAAFDQESGSSAHDTSVARGDTPEGSLRIGVSAVTSTADPPIEKFELPEVDATPPITAGARAPVMSGSVERPSRRLWPVAIAGAAIALIIGIVVGYLMVPSIDSTLARATIEPSRQGGTQLRLDYSLPQR